MLLARDIMTRDVVAVPPDMPLDEVGALLVDFRIHGAPVVDDDGRLVGMISVVDLVGRAGNVVADVMTPDPITAPEDAPVEELAGIMLGQAIRRIPIERDGRVVGIVSASDIIGLFLNLHERVVEPVEGSSRQPRAPGRRASLDRSRREPQTRPRRAKNR